MEREEANRGEETGACRGPRRPERLVMLLSPSFLAHPQESWKQKAGPEQMLKVLDLMLLKDILMHPIVHIFYPFITRMNLPTAISPLMHQSPYSFAYPKTSFQILIPTSSTVTLILGHPHQTSSLHQTLHLLG